MCIFQLTSETCKDWRVMQEVGLFIDVGVYMNCESG